jgi:hypothetical protein
MLNETLQAFRDKFDNGKFSLQLCDNLTKVIRLNKIPQEPGVYIIYLLVEDTARILYIGMAGTIQKNGQFKDQKLAGRLKSKQMWKDKKYSRAKFYKMMMKVLNINKLDFEWFVTFDDTSKVIPAKAEADLMQAYFDDKKELPDWNMEF